MSGNDPAVVLPYRDPEVLPKETLGRRQDGATRVESAARRGKQTPASGAPTIRQWLSSLEGPRKLTINGLLVIVSVRGSGVVLKYGLKQVAGMYPISLLKDVHA